MAIHLQSAGIGRACRLRCDIGDVASGSDRLSLRCAAVLLLRGLLFGRDKSQCYAFEKRGRLGTSPLQHTALILSSMGTGASPRREHLATSACIVTDGINLSTL